MSKLGDSLKAIEENKKTIAIESMLDEPPYVHTRNGWQNAIAEARLANERLLGEFKQEALANSVVMFVYGNNDAVNTFVDIAKSEATVFAVWADGLYRNIATVLEDDIRSNARYLVTGHLIEVVNRITDYARTHGMLSFNRIVVESDISVPTFEDTVRVIKNKVCQNNGDVFTRLWVTEDFSNQLIESQYKGNVVPVIVVVENEAEAMKLSPVFAKNGGIYDLNTTEVDKKFVLDVFQDVMKSNKKRKNS